MEFILVQWPDSQILMEQEWFDDCVLDAEGRYGSSAYFVPLHLFKHLYCQEPKEEDIA